MDHLSAFASLAPLPGGWSGQTLLAEAGGERSVVRIYARPGERGPAAHEVDAALLTLVRGLVPVPQVLEVRRASAAAGLPALLVTSFVPGERGELVVAGLGQADDRRGLATLGQGLGRLAACLAGMPTLRRGPLLDAELRIGAPEGRHADLPALVSASEEALRQGAVGGPDGWTDAQWAGLTRVADEAQVLLESVDRACLVHGDLTAANVLVDPGTLEVAGLVDWEDAHAGHPFADLGALLRHDRHPSYVEGVLEAWIGRHGGDRDAVLDLARAADMRALVALAVRARTEGADPPSSAADARLRAIARTGDVHARPDVG